MIKIADKYDINPEELEAFCRKHHIKLAVLHGSQVTGAARKESDIDIGILFKAGAKDINLMNIASDAVEILGEKCDPVFLNNAEPLICYEVAVNGIPIYEEGNSDFDEYQIEAIARFQDSLKFRLLEKEYLNQKIREME